MSRKSLSPKIRFEVFKRDSFTCQYCGSKAPDSILEIDHIKPVSKGGCNRGKSNNLLNDSSVIEKQRKQLEDMQERKDQIEAMFEWQKGLQECKNLEFKMVFDYIDEKMPGRTILRDSKQSKSIKAALKKYGLKSIMEAINISAESYLELDGEDITQDSADKYVEKIPSICYLKSDSCKYTKDMYYIRGILKNRLSYCNLRKSLEMIKQFLDNGYSFEEIKEVALNARNWTVWCREMEGYTEDV